MQTDGDKVKPLESTQRPHRWLREKFSTLNTHTNSESEYDKERTLIMTIITILLISIIWIPHHVWVCKMCRIYLYIIAQQLDRRWILRLKLFIICWRQSNARKPPWTHVLPFSLRFTFVFNSNRLVLRSIDIDVGIAILNLFRFFSVAKIQLNTDNCIQLITSLHQMLSSNTSVSKHNLSCLNNKRCFLTNSLENRFKEDLTNECCCCYSMFGFYTIEPEIEPEQSIILIVELWIKKILQVTKILLNFRQLFCLY